MKNIPNTSDFLNWINELKNKIHDAKRKAAYSLNSQIHELYWEIGQDICYKQRTSNWGNNLIEQIAIELKHEFPDMKGFSRRNLYAIRQWYTFYSVIYQFVPQPVAQILWEHNKLIITKIKEIEEAEFYCNSTIKNGWDRDTLELQISSNYYKIRGGSIHNFNDTLSDSLSKMAIETLKDPYNFDFLGLENDALEKCIEDELTKHITKFLLELGKGFALVGRQYPLEVSSTEYFLDMLFYHIDLRCFVVVELKAGKFKPEHVGKLNFYLSAVDTQMKRDIDNPTLGILLCKTKDKVEVEYALRDVNKPMGISDFNLRDALPENLKAKLPSIEELESQLEKNLLE